MKEIKDSQPGNAQRRQKLFWILWTETVDCEGKIRAASKKEALKVFYEQDEGICRTLEYRRNKRIRSIFVEEVSECD
jgi:hypothetical protein